MDVDEGVGELHGGVGLVVHVVVLPRHQLARRGLSRPRRSREPEDLALLLGLWSDVGAAANEAMIDSNEYVSHSNISSFE